MENSEADDCEASDSENAFSNSTVRASSMAKKVLVSFLSLFSWRIFRKIGRGQKTEKRRASMPGREKRNKQELAANEKIELYNRELMRAKTRYFNRICVLKRQKKILQKQILKLSYLIRQKRDVLPMETIQETV